MTTGFENSWMLSDYADCIRFADNNDDADDNDDDDDANATRVATIYIGDFRSAMSWKLLQDANVTGIVNCSCTIPNLFPQMFDYCNVNIPDVVSPPAEGGGGGGDDATVIPLPPSLLDEATAFVHSHSRSSRNDGKRGASLIHCRAGRSRSVAILVAYAIRYHRWTRDAALAYIRQMRRKNNRNGVVVTAPNRGFLRQLDLYQYRYQLFESSLPSSAANNMMMSQYYTVEWAKECRHYYQTLGMPDVCPQHTRWIVPVVLTVVEEDPAASMHWFQAVLIKLRMGPSNHHQQQQNFLALSTGWPETLHHAVSPPRPAIRTSKSF